MMLLAAGLVAGAMNAVVGGGTFVTLPALTLAGLPLTAANASSTVALFPGTLSSAWAYRHDVRPLEGVSTETLLILSLVGGMVGALLLLLTGGNIGWRETLLVMAGAVIGGYAGAHLGRRLPGP